jgi:hypothetical protein
MNEYNHVDCVEFFVHDIVIVVHVIFVMTPVFAKEVHSYTRINADDDVIASESLDHAVPTTTLWLIQSKNHVCQAPHLLPQSCVTKFGTAQRL